MPAMLDDPTSPTIFRTSGAPPYPDPYDTNPTLPDDVVPRQVTLRDRVTVATIVPFSSRHQVPPSLLSYLSEQLNKEIEKGDTYPMIEGMPVDKFGAYWFQNFGAVMLLGDIESPAHVVEGRNWATECLGSFYIKPNYPGRSSHVCNAGFLVTDAARNRGVGRLMGESYIEWAPKLGYTYSVFNLVYETNVASCRIWDALGFKRIGRVKGCGNLKSYPDQLIDAIIYGRDLGPEGEDFVSEERFDKIKFYLKYGKYPSGADRAEKSRLRSAATHYKLLENDKLMLKDKVVISDPQRQYEIAKNMHVVQHGGINKTTAVIAERYHWVRIKETVSLVIRNCAECKELGKAPIVRADGVTSSSRNTRSPAGASNFNSPTSPFAGQGGVSAAGRILSLPSMSHQSNHVHPHSQHHHQHQHTSIAASPSNPYADPFHSTPSPSVSVGTTTSVSPQAFDHSLTTSASPHDQQHHRAFHIHQHQFNPHDPHMQQHHHHHLSNPTADDEYMPLDPQIIEDDVVRHHLSSYSPHDHDPHTADAEIEADAAFQSMLQTHAENQPPRHHPHHHPVHHPHHVSVSQNDLNDGDGDLDMLLEDDEEVMGGSSAVPGEAVGSGSGVEAEEDAVKNRAQAAARAAEAALRGDEELGIGSGSEVGLYGDTYRDG